MDLSKIQVECHLPCDDCGSSDALTTYKDGHSFCYSCSKYTPPPQEINKILGVDNGFTGVLGVDKEDISWYNNTISNTKGIQRAPKGDTIVDNHNNTSTNNLKVTKGIQRVPKGTTTIDNHNNTSTNNLKVTNSMEKVYKNYRSISAPTRKKYGAYESVDKNNNRVIVYPYGNDAAKFRLMDKKDFYSSGDLNAAPLFGMSLFAPGSAKAITITEGEEDAMAAYEMLGSKYPVVSVRNTTSALKSLTAHFDYFNSFNKIYLCFDNDKPGQEALAKCARIFNPNKIFHVKMTRHNDPNDYLKANDSKSFVSEWWKAKNFLPKDIVSDFKSVESILRSEDGKPLATFPFHTLQEMTFGIFGSKLYTFLAKPKVGKTEIFRAIEHHLIKTTDHNLGIIHLEEGEKRSIQGLVSYEVDEPVHFPGCTIPVEEQMEKYSALCGREDRVYYYTHFGFEDTNVILESIRYLVSVCKCKFIFLDHISLLVSGLQDGDERRILDNMATKLVQMTRDLDFTLFLISHVNADGDPRGSQALNQLSDVMIRLERDKEAVDHETRNTTRLIVTGNRPAGTSGPAGNLLFDTETYKVAEKRPEEIKSTAEVAF